MFFVVSTGRSGTTSLAHLLDGSPDCICRHEPPPEWNEESTRYLYGDLPRAELVNRLQQTLSPTVEGKHYGEVSLKLSTMIPALHEAFPQAKFVWLIRDGRDFVASAYNWGFYHPRRTDEWERWRVRADRLGLMTTARWHSLSRFEKVCWHWHYINQHIEQQLTQCGCESFFVRLEDLDTQTDAIFDFLDLRRPDTPDVPHLNAKPKPRRWHRWNQGEKQAFLRRCGAGMDQHYPGWRDDPASRWQESLGGQAQATAAQLLRPLVRPFHDTLHRTLSLTRQWLDARTEQSG